MKVHSSSTRLSENSTDKELANYWQAINWKAVELHVNVIQTRIAKAIENDKNRLAKRLQTALEHSFYAKLLTVRKVTQSRGRHTPGIDGELLLKPADKMRAALQLGKNGYRAKPLKRIFIPKPGKATKRPLSIPTIFDRATQALYAICLQPFAETQADDRSFGFRLFRRAQDACEYAFCCLNKSKSAEWILEGDIRGCFDNISHEFILKHIPLRKGLLYQLLKAGFVFNEELFPTNEGTPQGGPLSPILANMVLDGLETELMNKYKRCKVNYLRYADDFIITAQSKELAVDIQNYVREFLKLRGLELSEEKTKITHINDGFSFLGWNFRKYGGKLLRKPSKESIQRVKDKIKAVVSKAKGWSQTTLIIKLNPIIIGWTNYHRHVVAKEIFNDLDFFMWNILYSWAKRRHQKKGKTWICQKYWHHQGDRNWVFTDGKSVLRQFTDTKIVRHRPLILSMNPFIDKAYFQERKTILRKKFIAALFTKSKTIAPNRVAKC